MIYLTLLFLGGCKSALHGQKPLTEVGTQVKKEEESADMTTQQTSVDKTNPFLLCNEILRALQRCDVEAIANTFSATNQSKLLPLDEKNRNRITELCQQQVDIVKGIEGIGELREAPSFIGEGAVVGKITVKGEEVIVIVLTKEGDSYGFEDINSPSIASYNALKIIQNPQ